uniref:Large ribosomal subunit protein uL30-like ferredoxin-like fold domain-containing protein n=1 Tax=Arcella intermedia TaxID=1963864 RepID=A0A6B2LGR7_9EUKA
MRKKKSLTRMENERKEKRDKKKLEKRKLPKPMKFVSAEKIVKASRQRSAQSIRIKRTQIKYKYLLEKPAEENKLVVAVRIRGFYGQTTMIKKILHELRLTTVRSAVFLKMTKRVMYLLKLVEPFVTYGTPTLRVVRDLITKRAYINLPGQQQRSPLNDNATIEKHLGELNIVCVEDIVNEIWNCGPAFEQVNKFLEPFKVILPPEGYKNKRDTYAEGGDSGDRGEKINDLLQRIL